tara:strand:+ start:1558 stop:2136 length:579 start_codon:yes stop_codon:yes gene_type:complete
MKHLHIAISTRTLTSPGGFLFDAYERGFNHMFAGHNIVPVLNRLQSFERIADTTDLLVLSGGDDHPTRLKAEIEMIKQYREREKPILGICHGAFLLTQLWGGECVDCIRNHRKTEHIVTSDKYNKTVNSYHGSSISSPPPDATTLVVDADGYCESWIYPERKTAVVVWHPERDIKGEHWVPDEILNLIEKET